MRVVVANRAVEFAEYLDVGKLFLRSIQACNNVGNFFAKRRRAGRLSVRARQHRQVGMFLRELVQLVAQVPHRGNKTSVRAERSIRRRTGY